MSVPVFKPMLWSKHALAEIDMLVVRADVLGLSRTPTSEGSLIVYHVTRDAFLFRPKFTLPCPSLTFARHLLHIVSGRITLCFATLVFQCIRLRVTVTLYFHFDSCPDRVIPEISSDLPRLPS